jgi:catechol 2,3-dioxygenase-like lactoylglutathione lyase family enzyme
MFAQINHVAVISHQYMMLGKFYEAMFGLKCSSGRVVHGPTYGDGYVGMQVIPRRDGYVAGIDHFGIVVDDVETVLERMQRAHPKAAIVRRPSTRPFAAYTGHDPDGNSFDLAQKKNDTRIDLYAEQAAQGWQQDRYFNKFAIRTLDAEQCAAFYAEVFELQPVNRKTESPGYHLTDGRMTLSILPWSVPIFEGMSIKRPGPDHLGFHVENMETFKAHVAEVGAANPYLRPMPVGGSPEANVRKRFFEKSAGGKWQIADSDGNWLDITDE